MTQLQQESSGSGAGAVVATVGCSVLGMMLAGPVGAVIGGTLAIAATASTAHRARHTRMELNISSISMPQDGITRQQGVTYFALDVVDTKGATWRVLRRYNHFDRFRKTLRRCGLRKPFPGRQVKGCGFGARLRERRLGLETWTREVVRIYSASGVPGRLESEFNDFFTRGRGQVTMVNQLGDQALPEGLGDIIFIATLTTLRTLLSIAVPPGVLPGQTLAVKVPDGRELHVVVPKDAGQELQLELDAASGTLSVLGAGSAPDTSSGSDDIFQIHVPSGVQPGQMVNIQVPDGRHLPFTVLMSALGFVPDEVLVYILQAHDARGAARQIARRCRKLVDANFNVRYIRPPAGKFFIVDFEVNDNLAKDLYCVALGEFLLMLLHPPVQALRSWPQHQLFFFERPAKLSQESILAGGALILAILEILEGGLAGSLFCDGFWEFGMVFIGFVASASSVALLVNLWPENALLFG
eukprot:s632_g17.t4